MAKKTVSLAEAVAALRTFADYLEQSGGSSTAGSARAPEVEQFDEEEIKGLALKELRELAVELDLDEKVKKAGILDEMAAKGYFAAEEEAEEDEGEEDEDDTSEEDEDEEEELSREDLEDMDLKELRELAKEEGHPRGSYIKADKDTLIELLLGDEEEDEDEGDEEEEDEDGDEDTQELDEESIRAMSLAEVKELAKELGVKVPAAIAKNRKKIADKILDEVAEEE